MRTSDVIVVGAGIIGLSLAIELRRSGLTVLVIERGHAGREASWAAGGMLVRQSRDIPAALQPLCAASATLYNEFVHQLEDESGMRVDLRSEGAIELHGPHEELPAGGVLLDDDELRRREPAASGALGSHAFLLTEQSVDSRALVEALIAAARHRDVHLVSGSAATALSVENGLTTGVVTERATYAAPVVVNCAGCWASQFGPVPVPARPVKGQLLALLPERRGLLRYTLRSPEVYLVPRSDGRVLVGATQEEVGYDKRVEPETIQRLHQLAAMLVPQLGEARMHEAWAGLRPGMPDALPALGATSIGGYFVAAGHFRNGILLAPITARLMAQLVRGEEPSLDVSAFSPARFAA